MKPPPIHYQSVTPSFIRASAKAVDRAVSIYRVRIFLGGVLLVAAALKADASGSAGSLPWRLAAALIAAELILAGFLFSGALPQCTWRATTLCFSCFALVAGVKTWSGEADCGCFGSIATPPWVALLIDVSALGVLFKHRERSTPRQTAASSGLRQLPMAVGFALIVVVGMKTVISISSVQPASATVDPAHWIGQRLPLLDDIDVGEELSSGAWTVILHRHGCAKCAEVLSVVKLAVHHTRSKIALVELPPLNAKTKHVRSADGMLLGYLHGKEYISLPVPLVLQIDEGRVEFAGDHFQSRDRELLTAVVPLSTEP